MTRSAATMLLAAGLLAMGACTHSENDRLGLGQSHVVPAFRTEPHTLPPAGPSVVSLDRSNWAVTEVVVPVQGTAHSPVYAPPHYRLDSLARQRGEFPTIESALELDNPDGGEEVWQTIELHAWAFVDAVLVLPRLAVRPPNATDWSPRLDYVRAPAPVITGTGCGDCPACLGAAPGECCAGVEAPEAGE